MTITADSKKRVRLGMAQPGDRFDLQVTADGAFLLRRLQPARSRQNKGRLANGGKHPVPAAGRPPEEATPVKARLEKRGKYTVIVTDRPVDMAVVKELLADFP